MFWFHTTLLSHPSPLRLHYTFHQIIINMYLFNGDGWRGNRSYDDKTFISPWETEYVENRQCTQDGWSQKLRFSTVSKYEGDRHDKLTTYHSQMLHKVWLNRLTLPCNCHKWDLHIGLVIALYASSHLSLKHKQ